MLDRVQTQSSARFVFRDYLVHRPSFKEAVLAGLSRPQKSIPCEFLYDARGSALFDRICELPEYYLTRTETAILKRHASDIAEIIGGHACLVELGSGSSAKTRILLDALHHPICYAPIDVSREHLRAAALAIARDYPALAVEAICANYAAPTPLPARGARTAAFFPGSTIGNLTRDEAVALMRDWRARVGDDGFMIIGIDLRKDAGLLNAAYDDNEGVTRAFIKNVLRRANQELGAHFSVDAFGYVARYVEDAGRVEMHLISRTAQSVEVAGRRFEFAAGERLHIENSHKYCLGETRMLATAAGFSPIACYLDERAWFSVQVWGA